MVEICEGLPFENYLKDAGINASGLKKMVRSPAHYRASVLTPAPETDAKAFGHLLHAALLEPERYRAHAVVRPKFDRRTKQGKADSEAWDKALPEGAIEVRAEWQEALLAMMDAVYSHPTARFFLESKSIRRELTLFWEDAWHGVRCKARLDAVSEGVVLDIKTCGDASRKGFSRAIWEYRYDIQAAHYTEGAAFAELADPGLFVFIALEKDPPYAVAVHHVTDGVLDIGAGWRHKLMAQYAACVRADTWPAYPIDDSPLDMPPWAKGVDDDDAAHK